jgi:hypothetical protein
MVFANLPSALEVRTDARWVDGMPAGWNFAQRQGTISIAPDAASPTGQSLRMSYQAGLSDGHEAGVAYWGNGAIGTHREMFMGVTMRYSANWLPHQNQVKLHLWNMQDAVGNQVSWFGIFDGCWQDRAGWWSIANWGREVIAWPTKNGDCWVNNRVPTPVQYTAGAWVKQELYARKSTPGLADGILRMWIDGVLVLEATNLRFPDTFLWGEFQHAGTWGGGGSAVPHAQSIHFARTLIATR